MSFMVQLFFFLLVEDLGFLLNKVLTEYSLGFREFFYSGRFINRPVRFYLS